MSSNNASNIIDIQKNTKFLKNNDFSNSTSLGNVILNSSGTYCENNSSYDKYMIDRTESVEEIKHLIPDEGDDMKNDEILRAYIDKVDNDQRELKQEMRERENRIEQNIRESEKRMDARLDRIEEMISSQNKNYDEKIEKLTSKFENSVIDIKSNKVQILALIIATILSVAGVAVAAIQVVQGFLSLVK